MALNIYCICFGFRGRAQRNRAVINALFAHNLLRLLMPPQIAIWAGERLRGLSFQLSVLDREFELCMVVPQSVR